MPENEVEINRWDTEYYCSLGYYQKMSEELYLTLCGRERCLATQCVGPMIREGYHIHVILSGKGYYETPRGLEILHAGQMFIIKPEEVIRYYADSETPWSYCWMAFDGTSAGEYAKMAGFVEGIYSLDCCVEVRRFFKLVERMMENTQLTRPAALRRVSILYEFLALAAESYLKSDRGGGYKNDFKPDMYVDYAVELMKSNYCNLKIADLSRYIGINRSYLTSIFKEKMGISPQQYLLEYRMAQGSEFLRTTDLPIWEVAKKVGYEDPLTFSKMFKKRYGRSLQEYRSVVALKQGAKEVGCNTGDGL